MTSTYGTREEYAAFAAKQDEAERSAPTHFSNDATLARIATLEGLLKEARKIVRASSQRTFVKDWDRRATAALAGRKEK